MCLGGEKTIPTTCIFGPWFRPRYDFKGDPLTFCRSFLMCERICRQAQHIWDGMSSGNHYKAQTCPWDFLPFLPDVGTACSSSLGCSCSSTHQLHTGDTEQVSPHRAAFSSCPLESFLCPRLPAQKFPCWHSVRSVPPAGTGRCSTLEHTQPTGTRAVSRAPGQGLKPNGIERFGFPGLFFKFF